MLHIIAASRIWNPDLIRNLERRVGHAFHLIRGRDEFTLDRIAALKPRFVYLPHWSYVIPWDVFRL